MEIKVQATKKVVHVLRLDLSGETPRFSSYILTMDHSDNGLTPISSHVVEHEATEVEIGVFEDVFRSVQ